MSDPHRIDVDDYEIENPELFVTSDLEMVEEGIFTEPVIKEEDTANTNPVIEIPSIETSNEADIAAPMAQSSGSVDIKQESADVVQILPPSEWFELRSRLAGRTLDEDGFQIDVFRQPETANHAMPGPIDHGALHDTGAQSPDVQPHPPADSWPLINSPDPHHAHHDLSGADSGLNAPTSSIMTELEKLHEQQLLAHAQRQKDKGRSSADSDIEFLHEAAMPSHTEDRYGTDSDASDQDDNVAGVFGGSVEEETGLGFQRRQQKRKRTRVTQSGKTAKTVLRRLEDSTRKEAKLARDRFKKKGKLPKKRTRKATKAEARRQERMNQHFAEFMRSFQTDVVAQANDPDGQEIPEVPSISLEGQGRSRKEALRSMRVEGADANVKLMREEEMALNEACQAFPGRMVRPAHSGRWEVRGMNSHLRPHQLLGSAWMLKREHCSKEKGGILADEMGFGKTVQILATMIGNRPGKGEPRATLIVCPGGLVKQWREEVRKHVKSYDPMFVHQSPCRLDADGGEELIEQAFCVITSYDEVRVSLKLAECPNELVTDEQIVEWHKKHAYVGILHRINWHRIVLDECTAMKNYQSATARACFMLEGKHRWLMSGTPLVNGVSEMYSYMCFLRMRNTGAIQHFESNFTKSETSVERLQATLQTIMYRRNHETRLYNRRIIKLPKCFKSTAMIEFTDLEQGIYWVCQKRFCYFVNEEAKVFYAENKSPRERGKTFTTDSKTRDKSIQNVLCLILRLRQIATHFLLAAETIRNLLRPEDRREISDILSSYGSGVGTPYETVRELRKALVEADSKARLALGKTPIYDAQGVHDGGKFGEKQIGGQRFLDIIDSLQGLEDEAEALCVFCSTEPRRPEVIPMETSCGHLYCQPCLIENQVEQADRGEERAKCYACGEVYESAEPVKKQWLSPMVTKKKQRERKENSDVSWIKQPTLPPSAKFMAVKAQVTTWLEQDPNCKIIIYTQFHSVILCLQRICDDESWKHLSYHGKMSYEARDQAVKEFADSPDKKILIVSLKAGGLGLNLTCANKIISLDLWWNIAVENQAFCRIFRIGQERETSVVRVAVRGSIDETLLRKQAHKSAAIDKALNDDNSMPRHTFEELMQLFGDVKYGEDSIPYVQPIRPPGRVWRGGQRGEDLNFRLVSDESDV